MRDESQIKLGDILEYSAGVGCEWQRCSTVRNQKDARTAACLLRASAARRPGDETFRYRLVRDGRVLDGGGARRGGYCGAWPWQRREWERRRREP